MSVLTINCETHEASVRPESEEEALLRNQIASEDAMREEARSSAEQQAQARRAVIANWLLSRPDITQEVAEALAHSLA